MENSKVLLFGAVGVVVVILLARSSGGSGVRTLTPAPANDPTAQARFSASASAFNTLANVYDRVTEGAQRTQLGLAQSAAAVQMEQARTAAVVEGTKIQASANEYAVSQQEKTKRQKGVLDFAGNVIKDATSFLAVVFG